MSVTNRLQLGGGAAGHTAGRIRRSRLVGAGRRTARMPLRRESGAGSPAARGPGARSDGASGGTLEDVLTSSWEDLMSRSRAGCPVCGAVMSRVEGFGRCGGCGSELH